MDRLSRVLLLFAVILLGVYTAQPFIERYLYGTAEPRIIAPRADLSDLERSTIALFRQAAPSVVQVASLPTGGLSSAGRGASTGSGFVWDSVGHIVTNNHVVENAGRVAVRLSTGDVVGADIVGRAPTHDLAVLRLQRRGALPPPLPLGPSSDLQVGQMALAIGNPFGLDQSLTTGVISALKRRLPTATGREIPDVIQTDAAVNPGNSGGPLLDSAGRVIGVNTAIFSPSGASAGIGFAIPSDVVNRIVPQLIRDGRVPVAGIGILAADEAETTSLGVSGVVVARTVQGMPAERAGLKGVNPLTGEIGDIITKVNGKPVRRLADLTDELDRIGPGRSVELTLRRDGRTVEVEVPVVDVGQG